MTTPLKADQTAEREAVRLLDDWTDATGVTFDGIGDCLTCETVRRSDLLQLIHVARATPTASTAEPVAYANPVILLPDEPGDEGGQWTAKVQSHKDDVFSLPLYTPPPAAAQADAVSDGQLDAIIDKWADDSGPTRWFIDADGFVMGNKSKREDLRNLLRAAISTKGAGEGKASRADNRKQLPGRVKPTGQPSDDDLVNAARTGFDDYWHEDCDGKDSEAWLASAKAVLVLAQPAAAEAPARKPLTDEQIKYAAIQADCKWLMKEYTFSLRSFARAIEAAHGIKEAP